MYAQVDDAHTWIHTHQRDDVQACEHELDLHTCICAKQSSCPHFFGTQKCNRPKLMLAHEQKHGHVYVHESRTYARACDMCTHVRDHAHTFMFAKGRSCTKCVYVHMTAITPTCVSKHQCAETLTYSHTKHQLS